MGGCAPDARVDGRVLSFLDRCRGPKCARRLGKVPGSTSSQRRGSAVVRATALALVAGVSNCGFPEYRFPAGTAGSGGRRRSAGRRRRHRRASARRLRRRRRTGGHVGCDGRRRNCGWRGRWRSGVRSRFRRGTLRVPAPVSYPAHCFDRSAGDGESGVDCGGKCAPCSSAQGLLAELRLPEQPMRRHEYLHAADQSALYADRRQRVYAYAQVQAEPQLLGRDFDAATGPHHSLLLQPQ